MWFSIMKQNYFALIGLFIFLICTQQTLAELCPIGYELRADNLCYPRQLICPKDYQLNVTDNLCYPINPVPCPFDETTTSTTTTTEPNTTTTSTEPTTTTTEPTTTTTEPTTTTTEPTTTTTEPTTTTTEPTTTTTEPNTTTTEPTTTTTEPTTTTTETTTTTTEPTTTTTEPPAALTRCPEGMVLYGEDCRKIICTAGEYRNGRCMRPACPPGTVWFNKRCQPPAYLTTIVDIEEVINKHHNYDVVTEHEVFYGTPPPHSLDNEMPEDLEIDEIQNTTTTPSTTTLVPPKNDTTLDCCTIITPRICKNYGQKWLCFHHKQQICDRRICKASIIYLKPDGIRSEPPTLIMPPNPPLEGCKTKQCKDEESIDCSGCAHNIAETCSPFCYQYHCPGGLCDYINHQDYCEIYAGEFGCTAEDGCLWDWCREKC